jgi:hypothetical protein
MSHPKLLKAPARVLLLTFVISARVAAGTPAAAPQIAPLHGQRPPAAVRSRLEQSFEGLDAYTVLHGIPRWGINE